MMLYHNVFMQALFVGNRPMTWLEWDHSSPQYRASIEKEFDRQADAMMEHKLQCCDVNARKPNDSASR